MYIYTRRVRSSRLVAGAAIALVCVVALFKRHGSNDRRLNLQSPSRNHLSMQSPRLTVRMSNSALSRHHRMRPRYLHVGAVDEASVLDRVVQTEAVVESEQKAEKSNKDDELVVVTEENTDVLNQGPFIKEDGSSVTLEDCIGVYDLGPMGDFIDEQKPMPSKWASAKEDILTDPTPIAPPEDADYMQIFGMDPDRDERFVDVLDMIDEAQAKGKQTWSSIPEVPDAPPFSEEDLPDRNAEGCLDILLGEEPDIDPMLQGLYDEMDQKGGIEFRRENVEDTRPPQEGQPGELLEMLFTDPDPDPLRDPLFSEMESKNPQTEVPNFVDAPEPAPYVDEQIVLVRDDQMDSMGRIVDPDLLAADPALVQSQTEKKAVEEAISSRRSAPKELTAEEIAKAEAEVKKQEEIRAKQVEEAEKRAAIDREAREKAAVEAAAKIKAEAEARKELELAEKKKKEESVAVSSAAVDVAEPQGYVPPVVEGMPSLDDVTWTSELSEDYSPLRELLRKGDFRGADDWTRAKLIDIAGPKAQERGWVYFAEVPRIPYGDLKAIDDLWRAGSGGRFGYSRQREIYARQGQDLMKMYSEIDWVTKGQDKPCPGCRSLCPTCVTFEYRSWKVQHTFFAEI